MRRARLFGFALFRCRYFPDLAMAGKPPSHSIKMKDYAKQFYQSKEWKKCRKVYLNLHPYCERCEAVGIIKPAKVVHHKCYITPQNITDTDVTLNFDNFEALCQDCHNAEHHADSQVDDGLMFTANGKIVHRGACKK